MFVYLYLGFALPVHRPLPPALQTLVPRLVIPSPWITTMAFLASLLERAISRPSASVILYYLLGFLLIIHAIRRVRGWYRLRHIPGPALAGWTSLWLTRRYLRGTFCQDVPDLVEKYGASLVA